MMTSRSAIQRKPLPITPVLQVCAAWCSSVGTCLRIVVTLHPAAKSKGQCS